MGKWNFEQKGAKDTKQDRYHGSTERDRPHAGAGGYRVAWQARWWLVWESVPRRDKALPGQAFASTLPP